MIGCLLGLFIWPFRLIKYCVTNGWKGLIILAAIIIIIIILGVSMTKGDIKKSNAPVTTSITKTNVLKGIPTVKEAPYIVYILDQYIYAEKATKKDGVTTISVYWELINKTWVKKSGTLFLNEQFGKITIKKR
ncbi:MAG: hypothetical protein PHQ86_01875 [Dehalococcoidales bacterium]|nr:hypothetical protein [Dehalococcoidales bacterium]